MENYCLLLPDPFNIRPKFTMIKGGHCVHVLTWLTMSQHW